MLCIRRRCTSAPGPHGRPRRGPSLRFVRSGRSVRPILVAPFVCCALLALSACASLASAQPPRTAVMDLRAGEGVTEPEARTLTGMLRSALHDTGAFTLINREDMEDIARNHEIELIFCDDDACLLQVGSLLGAQKLVAGEIGLVLGEFIVNARLVDIAGNALANERVASRRSAPRAEALQEAMEEMAAILAGRPMPARGELDPEGGSQYDGRIYAREGDHLLIDRGRRRGVERGTIYEVFAPPGGSQERSRDDAGLESRPRRVGRIEVVEVRESHSAALWQHPPAGLTDPSGCSIRRFRLPSWLTLEACCEFHWPVDVVAVEFAEEIYVDGELMSVLTHRTRVQVEGLSLGAAAILAPRGRLGLGVRASAILADAVRYGYAQGPLGGGSFAAPPEPAQSMLRLGGELRLRLLASRAFDVELSGGLDRVFWDLDLLDRDGMRPPWGIADLRAGLRIPLLGRWGAALQGGACASLGGDWRVSSLLAGIGLFRSF